MTQFQTPYHAMPRISTIWSGLPAHLSTRLKGAPSSFRDTGKIILSAPHAAATVLLKMQHIPRKSHNARRLAIELLCNCLCSLSQKIWRALVYMKWITVTDASTRVSLLGTARWTVWFCRRIGELYCSVVTEQELSQNAKLSV